MREPLLAVPATCRDAVAHALRAAFGRARIDAVSPVGGGASGALPFRVDIADRRYLVRVEGPASPLRNPHQYASMIIAAGAGIAPALHHVDETARVVVMDLIDEQPLDSYPGGRRGLMQALGEMMRRVQATPCFPAFIDYGEMVGRLWWWVCGTGLFAPDVLAPHTERLARLRGVLDSPPTSAVSSHNDLVPRNVLFDGERLWLIDWESAYRNDPLVDVAIALDCFASSPDLERLLLEAFLGRPADEAFRARLAPIRALTRLYYAGVLLSASFAASGALADSDPTAPSLPEFRELLRLGQLQPGRPATKHILGKMYLASFLTGVPAPGLDAAV